MEAYQNPGDTGEVKLVRGMMKEEEGICERSFPKMEKIDLRELGWDEFYASQFIEYEKEEKFVPGRIAVEHKHLYRVYTAEGDFLAEVSGKFCFEARERSDYPAVGDWVVLSIRPAEKRGTIHAVLQRKNKFSRKVAGLKTDEQIVAANIDYTLLITSLNQEFNPRRIERYLALIWDSGSNPVVVMNKADLCSDLDEKIAQLESVAIGVPYHITSCLDGRGVDELAEYLAGNRTIAFLGSSGVGKSTIINRLLGEERQDTGEIRYKDSRGKHTTTYRELIIRDKGGLLLDTPGMREIQLWNAEEGMGEAFDDIEELARSCKFNDCKHDTEPGCAVKEAIARGIIAGERLENYRKMKRELIYLEFKQKQKASAGEKMKWEDINRYEKHILRR
ncbi:MAG: ribosome small subunit-dependent GTPase A [Halanaerobium sp.]|nr:ribosome small subunit-dependent GTPase A [Halanaerobium sp.]